MSVFLFDRGICNEKVPLPRALASLAGLVCLSEYNLLVCQSCHLTTPGKRNIRERKRTCMCVGS